MTPITFRRKPPDCVGIVRFYVDLRIDVKEMEAWKPERIKAFFGGLTLAISAANGEIAGPLQIVNENEAGEGREGKGSE